MSISWRLEAHRKISDGCVQHRRFVETVEYLFNHMTFAQPGEVIVLVGPSRVGKSRAAHLAADRLIEGATPQDGVLPFIIVEAENSSRMGSFSSKAFMRSCLEAVGHPIYGACRQDEDSRSRLDTRINRTPEGVLRDALEHALRIRQTRYLIIDEAHHVGYSGRSSYSGQAILDSWKCMANKTGVVLVLVGGYRLLDLIGLASHLVGRLRPIHFSRYQSTDAGDVAAFEQILQTWGQHLRFGPNDSLRRVNSYLFKHSYGCIGHLSKWLRTALSFCESRDLDAFSREVLAEARHPAQFERTILDDIAVGERFFEVGAVVPGERSPPTEANRKPNKPFKRKPQRYERGGRA